MWIRKFDFDFGRRFFIETATKRFCQTGVLASLWPEICRSGGITSAYPDELIDIETYTKGRVKVGDVIDADNIELVQDLVDPILYQQVAQDRRKFFIDAPVTDIRSMFPPYFFDATVRNQYQATFGTDGNVYTRDGAPWIGGLPFPDPHTAEEAIANITLSWGRHDRALYAVPARVFGADGETAYEYDFLWAEMQCTGLVHPNASNVYLPGNEDKVRFQMILFTHTNDVRGTAFLNIWKYDQRMLPDLFGYLPQFKRVRRFPANQRFRPYTPGMNLSISDAWTSGDPMLTWGNFKLLHRRPFLGSANDQWSPQNDNWLPPLVGGSRDKSYFYVGKSLVPDVLIFEAEPTGFHKVPVSKRRLYVDARNMAVLQAINYDHQGLPWKSYETGFGQQKAGVHEILTTDRRIEWSWNWVISHDMQSNSVTRFHQGEKCRGNFTSQLDPEGDMYHKYMTIQAIRRLGH